MRALRVALEKRVRVSKSDARSRPTGMETEPCQLRFRERASPPSTPHRFDSHLPTRRPKVLASPLAPSIEVPLPGSVMARSGRSSLAAWIPPCTEISTCAVAALRGTPRRRRHGAKWNQAVRGEHATRIDMGTSGERERTGQTGTINNASPAAGLPGPKRDIEGPKCDTGGISIGFARITRKARGEMPLHVRPYRGEPELPEPAVGGGGDEPLPVNGGERLQPDSMAFERDWGQRDHEDLGGRSAL